MIQSACVPSTSIDYIHNESMQHRDHSFESHGIAGVARVEILWTRVRGFPFFPSFPAIFCSSISQSLHLNLSSIPSHFSLIHRSSSTPKQACKIFDILSQMFYSRFYNALPYGYSSLDIFLIRDSRLVSPCCSYYYARLHFRYTLIVNLLSFSLSCIADML